MPDIFCTHSGAVKGKWHNMKDHVSFKFTHPKPPGIALDCVNLESISEMVGKPQECC